MKPADFLLGLLDFFAILLPGAVAVWLGLQYLDAADYPRIGRKELSETAGWAAFLLASYVLGHFVFMIGAGFDRAYDTWRKLTKPTSRDATFRAADDLRKRINPALTGAEFSTLKWAKSYIQIQSPAARVEIDRLEATSKFFRSFVVIAVALALHLLLHERRPGLALAALGLALLSWRRFFEERWKATELTYATACVVDATGRAKVPGTEAADQDES